MIDSAARAERFDPAPSITPYYTWEVPQKPVLVRLPLLLIDRLEREAVENFRSVSSRGSEIGGVLWGSVDPGEPTGVAVAEFEMVECDYALGPLYRLSETDTARVERVLAQRGSGLIPVGFFRSHTRKGLALDADDLALMEALFKEPYQIALVVRPYATKASAAGIFIREGGLIHSEASYLEFPFRSAQLAPSKHLADAVEPPMASAPAPPRPVVRAQIVPIASRRDIVTPAPTPAPTLAAEPAPPPAPVPPVVQPQPVLAPQPVAQAMPAPPVEAVAEPDIEPAEEAIETAPALEPPVAEPPVAVAEIEEQPETAVALVAAAAPPAIVEDSVPAFQTEAPARTRGSNKLMWLAVGAIFPLLLSGVLFIYPGFFHHATPGSLAGQDNSPLALRVERTGSELLLTWNRDSGVIHNASHAVLQISDGDQHENVDMDLAQLRNGSIVYLPVTADVEFRMEVSGKDKAKTTSESVRVLRTRPSPMPTDSQTPGAPNQAVKPGTPNTAAPNTPVSNGATPAAGTPNGAAPGAAPTPDLAAETPASNPAVALKPFNTASLSQRLRPVRSDEIALPDAPTVGGESVAASDAALKLTSVTGVAPPPAPRKAEAPVASAPKPAPGLPTGGDVQSAQLIYRKSPEYPKIARDAGARGSVELIATIGTNGRVKSVRAVKGHPLLQKAAIDAVMQWQYKPTTLNGQPVETESAITLNFVNDR